MPFSINPDLIENNDVEIQTVDGELALFHKPSGNTLIVDEDTTVSEKLQSPLRDNVDLDGNDLISGGNASFEALEADALSIRGEDQFDEGDILNPMGGSTVTFGSISYSNEDYQDIDNMAGTPVIDAPSGFDLVGRGISRMGGNDSKIRPVLWNGNTESIDELEIEKGSGSSNKDTGWVDVEIPSDVMNFSALEGRVEEGGSGDLRADLTSFIFAWRWQG